MNKNEKKKRSYVLLIPKCVILSCVFRRNKKKYRITYLSEFKLNVCLRTESEHFHYIICFLNFLSVYFIFVCTSSRFISFTFFFFFCRINLISIKATTFNIMNPKCLALTIWSVANRTIEREIVCSIFTRFIFSFGLSL